MNVEANLQIAKDFLSDKRCPKVAEIVGDPNDAFQLLREFVAVAAYEKHVSGRLPRQFSGRTLAGYCESVTVRMWLPGCEPTECEVPYWAYASAHHTHAWYHNDAITT